MSLENLTIHVEDVNTSDNNANNHKREFVPLHWNSGYLGEVCLDKPQNGAFIKNPQIGEGTLFVNVYDIYQNIILDIHAVQRLRCDKSLLETYSLRKNDLLFVRSSLKLEGIGQCCLVKDVEESAIFDCHLIRISPDISKVEPLYLAFYFLSRYGKHDLIARSKTTTMTTINQNTLTKSLIPIPPLPEQRAIAHILQTAQNAIQARRKELELERERKAALMMHLFTHGTRDEPTKQTEIGEVPENWEIVRLGMIYKICYGLGQPPQRSDRGIPMIRATDIKNGHIKPDTVIKVESKAIPEKRAHFLKKGDIIVVRSGAYAGDVASYDGEWDIAIAGYDLVASPISDGTDSCFITNYLLGDVNQRYFRSQRDRSAQPHINADQLSNAFVPLPSEEEQKEIATILQACDSKITTLEKEIALQEELFRALLDELMTGRLSTLPLVE